jgi:Grx4 family monothiol glutaredoxin
LFIIGMSVIKAIEGFEVPLLYESIQHYTQNFSTELERVRNAYNEQLHRIINEKALAVFIKGTPEAPKTRRTHQMVRILNGYDYSYFNVTTDKALTEWLKLYTNSPMLPQFFIKGNYSGTLEELIELSKSGTLFTELSQDLNTRLQKIINSHKLLVVVKGSKEQPLCGFSRKMMQLLDEYQLDYETFDILLDYQVREGLKKLSNWPTYPQVYANGELVGGLDICMELHSQGSLIDAINPS